VPTRNPVTVDPEPTRGPLIPLVPSARLGWLLAALGAAAVVALAARMPLRELGTVVVALMAGLLVAAIADALATRRAWRAAPLVWRRVLPPAMAIGAVRKLEGTLVNAGTRPWRVRLFDGIDPSFEVDGLPVEADVPAGATLSVAYEARPRQRGMARFAPAELRVRSLLRLFEHRFAVGEPETVRVFPNFAAVSRYAWLAGDRRLAEIGVKSFPRRGSGTDFKQLAEYKPGDAIRSIDWKATQRHGRPVVREYQDERDQRVVFLLDCGRRMRADESAGALAGRRAAPSPATPPRGAATAGSVGAFPCSHFDSALDATLLLAWVALAGGDEVGAMTFGGGPGEAREIAPRKGVRALDGIVTGLFDVEPRPTQPDYRAAATAVMRAHQRRSLVVLLTNFRAEDADDLADALRLLRTRHLVLVASLRERALADIALQPLVTEQDAIEVAGAHLFAQDRDSAFRRLAARDALLLDVEPEGLAVALVNRYHAVKRAGLL
jgi:uncharacterized protein (DUF58 family)